MFRHPSVKETALVLQARGHMTLLLQGAMATKGFPQLEREAMLAKALTALDAGNY